MLLATEPTIAEFQWQPRERRLRSQFNCVIAARVSIRKSFKHFLWQMAASSLFHFAYKKSHRAIELISVIIILRDMVRWGNMKCWQLSDEIFSRNCRRGLCEGIHQLYQRKVSLVFIVWRNLLPLMSLCTWTIAIKHATATVNFFINQASPTPPN